MENKIEGFSPDLQQVQKENLFKTLKNLAPEIVTDGHILFDKLKEILSHQSNPIQSNPIQSNPIQSNPQPSVNFMR